jgi:hypothetical protein
MIGRLTSTAEVVGENGKGVCDLIAPEPSLCLNLRNDRYTCSHVFRNVPLGYDASERPLVINPAGAETVRRIFALYRELGCVRRVNEEADRLGLRTKCRTPMNGMEQGGKPFSRGHLYRLLSNPIYTGQMAHKGELYPGQHPALIAKSA